MDERDVPSWVVIALSPEGDRLLHEGKLENVVRRTLGPDVEVFVPAVVYDKAGRRTSIVAHEGYVFVRSGLPEIRYFAANGKSWSSGVISVRGPGGYLVPKVIRDSEIRQIKDLLASSVAADRIRPGACVKVLSGTYRTLTGVVVVESKKADFVHVEILLRSVRIFACLPRAQLELVEAAAPESKSRMSMESPA